MTSKQRAYLKGLAMTMDPILQLGKGGLTPENTAAVEEALAARELIKISVLQNCLEDPREMAQVLAVKITSSFWIMHMWACGSTSWDSCLRGSILCWWRIFRRWIVQFRQSWDRLCVV